MAGWSRIGPGARATPSALIATAALCGVAAAQTPTPPAASVGCTSAQPTYRFLRYLEDFQSLRDPACLSDPWDGVKHIALSETGDSFLTLGGDARLQLINARYLSFGNEGGDNHNVFLQRYHVHAGLRVSSQFRLFAELKSNAQHGASRIRWQPTWTTPTCIRPSSISVDIGDGAARRAPGVGLRFGAPALPAQWPERARQLRRRATGVACGRLARRCVRIPPGRDRPGFLRRRHDRHTDVLGRLRDRSASGNCTCAAGRLLHRRESRGRPLSARGGERAPPTLGARLFGRSEPWDHDHEVSLQWGRFGTASIRAWAIASETGYTWGTIARQPLASLRVSIASVTTIRPNPPCKRSTRYLRAAARWTRASTSRRRTLPICAPQCPSMSFLR